MPTQDFVITSSPTLIDQSDRAIVYLAVDWSIPERRSRKAVSAALATLSQLRFEFFAVSEDDEAMRPWLRAHGWPKHELGYGSLMWLEYGRQVAKELFPAHVGSDAVVAKTRSVWAQPAA